MIISNIPQYLQKYICLHDMTWKCPLCYREYKLSPYCNICSCGFELDIITELSPPFLKSFSFDIYIEGFWYKIYQRTDHIEYFSIYSSKVNINLYEVVELDFPNIEEQIETLLLFS